MHYRWSAVMMVMVVCLVSALSVYAESLQEDYRAFEARRAALEEQRKDFESRMAALASRVKSLNMVFFQCVSPKEPDYWEEKIAEAKRIRDALETERLAMSTLRKQIDEDGKRLENRRREIEEIHTRKGPGTPYEADFREYMAALSDEYFLPVETRLFAGYRTYLDGVEHYVAFLKDSVGRCMQRDRN